MESNNPYQGPSADVLVTQAGSGTVGQAQKRPVGNGGAWWAQAWQIVRQNKLMWALATFVFLLIFMAIGLITAFIPFIGTFIPTLFAPVFVVGLYFIAHRVREQNTFSFGDLFVGFSNQTGPLFMAGLAQIVAMLVFFVLIGILGALFFGSELMMMFSSFADPYAAPMMNPAFGVAKMILFGLVSLLLIIPYMAAIWFQVPLVFFGQRNAFAAMVESFTAVFRNFLAMLWYGIIGFLIFLVLGIAAAIIVGVITGVLGQGVISGILMFVFGVVMLLVMLVLMALYSATIYCSFRDIFELGEAAPRQPASV
ncbi:predicted integral membrane protein DUF2189 [Alloalcanivorax xenomutans]|uniref:BPSS1780 family membrane protein n=1 Tax=Alloalcanivorax xenomutans TaxID=1094342 RepID=UPI000BD77D4E|nr:BPSS1780 family membrane protein [Alloalcanivorax xenomutans]SOC15936.1 predicted integral membrane protein DUF2189 [Alloalcanivorax xenomutans]